MMRLGLQTALHGLRQPRLLTIGTGNGTTTSFTQPPQVTPGTAIYVNDWQGNQLQYSTPRTNEQTYSITPANWVSGGLDYSAATALVPGGTPAKVTGTGVFSTIQGVLFSESGLHTVSWILENVSEVQTLFAIIDNTSSTSVASYLYTWANGDVSKTAGYDSASTYEIVNMGIGPNGGALIKLSVSATGTVGDSIKPFLYPDAASSTTNSLIIHAGQVETGGVATSIIATTTSPVTVTDYSLSGGNVVFAVAPPSSAAITATA